MTKKLPSPFKKNPPLIPSVAYDAKAARDLCRAYTQDCIDRLVKLMMQDEERSVALAATKEILDRAYGKARDTGTDPGNGLPPVHVSISFAGAQPTAPAAEPQPTVIDQPTTQH